LLAQTIVKIYFSEGDSKIVLGEEHSNVVDIATRLDVDTFLRKLVNDLSRNTVDQINIQIDVNG